MKANARVKKLLNKDDDLAIWFALLCESGPQAIEAQAWQVADVLKTTDESEVRDAMLELAHELLPGSPSGEDPRQVLFRELGVWASKQGQDVQKRLSVALQDWDGFLVAWESGLSGFRKYLRGQCEAALEVAA